MLRCVPIVLTLLLLGLPRPARAQVDNHVAIGLDITQRAPQGPAGHGNTDLGFSWRLGTSTEGWSWTSGFGWYSTEIDHGIGRQNVEFGELKVRPVMAGYGYTHVMGRTSVSAKLLGGYAFTSFHLSAPAADAYRTAQGAPSVSSDVANTFVVRPEVSVWYDLNQRVGLHLEATYVIARPVITIRSGGTTEAWRYRADSLGITVGFVYSVF